MRKKPLLPMGTFVSDSPIISKGFPTFVQLLSSRLLAFWTVYSIPSIPLNETLAVESSVEILISGEDKSGRRLKLSIATIRPPAAVEEG
jgi:hypothetical protein